MEDVESPRESRRKRRAFWKKRRFWIVAFGILLSVGITLWLIASLGNFKDSD